MLHSGLLKKLSIKSLWNTLPSNGFQKLEERKMELLSNKFLRRQSEGNSFRQWPISYKMSSKTSSERKRHKFSFQSAEKARRGVCGAHRALLAYILNGMVGSVLTSAEAKCIFIEGEHSFCLVAAAA